MDKFEQSVVGEITQLYKKLQIVNIKKREHAEKEVDTEGRSEYARDYARILYSSSFRRLQGKMQILGIESTAFYRNRMTHSLEVSQIARSLARTLSWKCGKENEMYTEEELYLLDAAALAHDIGHPSFGHKGERVLDEIAKLYGYRFEGNAQNFRVLRKLDRHGSSKEGLNLTYRTLLAINKYNTNEKSEDGNMPEKFMYHDDFEFLYKFRENNNIKERTLDVQIIEIADDIAYAVHDLEDGLSQGMFTIDELSHEIKAFNDAKEKIIKEDRDAAYALFDGIVEEIKKELEETVDITTIQEYSHLFRKKLTSKLTDSFVRSIAFDNDKSEIDMDKSHKALCSILSKKIFKGVTRNSNIALYELKGEIVIKSLFNIYVDKKVNKKFLLLPPDYRPEEKAADEQIARCVIDYIAGMMDTFAISEFERLTGTDYHSINVSKIPEVSRAAD
jgi:dGTPase